MAHPLQAAAPPPVRGPLDRRGGRDDGQGPGGRGLRPPAGGGPRRSPTCRPAATPPPCRSSSRTPCRWSGATRVLIGDFPSPRTYGTFPVILAEFVREDRFLALPDAIRKMTSFPAQRLGLPDRGLLRDGFKADVVVFDREDGEGAGHPHPAQAVPHRHRPRRSSTARWSWTPAGTPARWPGARCAGVGPPRERPRSRGNARDVLAQVPGEARHRAAARRRSSGAPDRPLLSRLPGLPDGGGRLSREPISPASLPQRGAGASRRRATHQPAGAPGPDASGRDGCGARPCRRGRR